MNFSQHLFSTDYLPNYFGLPTLQLLPTTRVVFIGSLLESNHHRQKTISLHPVLSSLFDYQSGRWNYNHTLHKDVSVNDGRTHVTLVPWDYNGAEKFLSPSDLLAIERSQHNTLSRVCGDAGVNKPVALPSIKKHSAYNYLYSSLLENDNQRPCYCFTYLVDPIFYHCFRVYFVYLLVKWFL